MAPQRRLAHVNGRASASTSSSTSSHPSQPAMRASTPEERFSKPVSAMRQQGHKQRLSAAAVADQRSAKRAKTSRMRGACTHCQHLKMRCSGATDEESCERCIRTGKECLVVERAPHRSWTKRKDTQIQQLTTKMEEMEGFLKKVYGQSFGNGDAEENNDDDDDEGNEVVSQSSSCTSQAASGMLPAEQRHPFVTSSVDDAIDAATNDNEVAYVQSRRHLFPFVRNGKVTAHEAAALFHIYMQSCALHTGILDPEWHTLARVCDASPLLFGVTMYIGSMYYAARRTLRAELEDEMDTLIGKVVSTGTKSIEVVQAFLLLYQWNRPAADPAEDRAWLLAGVAIRMATELQVWKPQRRFGGANTERRQPETDMERINRERCWMMTFSVDRSLSLAVGRPWTINDNAPLIRDSAHWFEQKAARPWDLGISALHELLKLISRQSDVFHDEDRGGGGGATTRNGGLDAVATGEQSDLDCDTTMRVMNAELEHWRRKWYAKGFFTSPIERDASTATITTQSPAGADSAAVDALDLHLRTLHYVTKQATLRYHFAVLVLNSFGLQYCVKRPSLTHTRTSCITRAIQAAQSMVKAARDGLGATMTYSPQTQYTIFGFCLVSLIKLAALVDKVVAEGLIASVTTSITFLEEVAVASDHAPARLASLLRAMLRRRKERRGVTGHVSTPAFILSKQATVADHVQEGEEDGAGESTFAPELKAFKLPHRSSRTVTPTRGIDFVIDNEASLPASTPLDSPPNDRLSITAADRTGPDDLPPSDDDNDAAAEAMLQSLGMFGSIDTSGWTQMTLDQILDESFWLRFNDGPSLNGASTIAPTPSVPYM